MDLSETGRAFAAEVAERHQVSPEAVAELLRALAAGHGTQAQFSHPDLGGMGQWSRGGMIMVGDMFNNALKAKVDALCTELSAAVLEGGMFAAPHGSQSQSQSDGAAGVSLFVLQARTGGRAISGFRRRAGRRTICATVSFRQRGGWRWISAGRSRSTIPAIT